MEEAGSDGVPGVPLGGAAAASLSLQRDPARQGQGRPPTAVTGSHRRGGDEAEGNAQEEPDPLAAALLPPPETGQVDRRRRGQGPQAANAAGHGASLFDQTVQTAHYVGVHPRERNATAQDFAIGFGNHNASANLSELDVELKKGFVFDEKFYYVGAVGSDSPLSGLLQPGDCLIGVNGSNVLSFQAFASPDQEATTLVAAISLLIPAPIIQFKRQPIGVVHSDTCQARPPPLPPQVPVLQRPQKSDFPHGEPNGDTFDENDITRQDSLRPISVVEDSQLSDDSDDVRGGEGNDPLSLDSSVSCTEGQLLNLWIYGQNELISGNFNTEDDFLGKGLLVDLSKVKERWTGSGRFIETVPYKQGTYGMVVGYSGSVNMGSRRRVGRAASNNFFLVAFVTIAGRLSAVKISQVTCRQSFVYTREHAVEPTLQEIPNIQALVDGYDTSVFQIDESCPSNGRQVDLEQMLGLGIDRHIPSHAAGTKGQVIAVSADKYRVLIAYQKSGTDDSTPNTWGVFEYHKSIVRRHWSTHFDEDEPQETPLRGLWDAITNFSPLPNVPLEEMEPQIMRDDKAARLSIALFTELVKIRMFGDKAMFERVLRDYPLDKEVYDDDDMQIIDRRIAIIDEAIADGTIDVDTSNRYCQHVNYQGKKEDWYPLSMRAVEASLEGDIPDDFSFNPVDWYASSRFRFIKFDKRGEDKSKLVACNPKDGDGYAKIFIPNTNTELGTCKGVFIPRNYAVFFTFCSLFSCTPADFKAKYGVLDHADMDRSNDLTPNQGPMTPSFNQIARHIPGRNNTTGIVGVSKGDDDKYYVGQVNDEDGRIRTAYDRISPAANHRRFLETANNKRAHLGTNHLILEILHGDGWPHLMLKEFLRHHLIHRDFDLLNWDARPGNSYDLPDLEMGRGINIIDGFLSDLDNGALRILPTLNGDILVCEVDKSDVGAQRDHLFEAIHEALIQKDELLPIDLIEGYIHRHWKYAQRQRQYIMTKNRLSIERECKDGNFKRYLGLNALPRRVDGTLDLSSLPHSKQGKYELLTASVMNSVSFVIWNEIANESTTEYSFFKNTTRYDPPGYAEGVIHIALCNDKWSVLNILPYHPPS